MHVDQILMLLMNSGFCFECFNLLRAKRFA